MTLQAGDKLMSLADVSEMLGIPVHTLYRWRYKGGGPVGYRIGRHVRYRREAVEAWLEQRADQQAQLKNQSRAVREAADRQPARSGLEEAFEHPGRPVARFLRPM